MPALAAFLEAEPHWKELLDAVHERRSPHAVGFVVPKAYQRDIAVAYAKSLLCREGRGDCGCASCRSWNGEEHPDLIFAIGQGKADDAPGIERCREMAEELFLLPTSAPVRLGVVWGADKLSPPAANSLLKLAEEPPASGSLLFLMERDALLPTLRSRLRQLVFRFETGSVEALAIPREAAEWMRWLAESKKKTPEQFRLELTGWAAEALRRNHPELAADMESLGIVIEKRRLGAAMAQDMVVAVVKEGVRCEEIFGDLWEA